VHFFGQTTYVVMAFDCLSRDVQTFNAVRVDSALCQPFGVGYFMCFGIEYFYKVTANNFTLLFRVSHAFQVFKELVAGIYTNYVQSQTFVVVHYVFKLILA